MCACPGGVCVLVECVCPGGVCVCVCLGGVCVLVECVCVLVECVCVCPGGVCVCPGGVCVCLVECVCAWWSAAVGVELSFDRALKIIMCNRQYLH